MKKLDEGKRIFHVMMIFLVIVWGLEYAVAKDALDHVDTLIILNVKYFFGALLIAAVAKKTAGFRLPDKRDVPVLIGTTILGHIIYFYCEYAAMATVPVANITIILGFLPIGSILIEKLFFHRRTNGKLILFMMVCIIGIFLTIGADFRSMRGGSGRGYLMCLGALGAWLAYLFLTEKIAYKYGSIEIALWQTVIAWLLTSPVMVPHVAELPALPPRVMMELLYLGIVSEGLCFLAEVTGLEKLGPTISAVYSNFLPVTSALFGMLLLHQDLVLLQYLGGALVIAAGFLVIREKDRLDLQG
ncbi:MAG: DMT family transporter [Firmicutes bacterium]|nr:DMT family transporter [Bacillota bacterium]